MGSLQIATENRPTSDVHLVTLDGDLDSYSAPELRGLLTGLLANGPARIVLDCSALDYVDSSGLGTLVAVLKQTSDAHGALVLACPQEKVMRVLRVTGLHRLFPVYDSVEAASNAEEMRAA